MKIPAWLDLVFKIIIGLLGVFTAASLGAPQYFGGPALAPAISFWLSTASGAVGTVYTILGTGTVPSLTTIGKVS
jgi:hypothetical protein